MPIVASISAVSFHDDKEILRTASGATTNTNTSVNIPKLEVGKATRAASSRAWVQDMVSATDRNNFD